MMQRTCVAMSNRQTVYQQLHRELGLCILCPRPTFKGGRCKEHYVKQLAYGKEYYRRKNGYPSRALA